MLIDYRHGKGRIVVLSDPFIVANNGHGPLYATCELNAAPGTSATFDDGQLVKPVSLLEGQTRDLSVRVQADGSDTVSEPHMTCNASAV